MIEQKGPSAARLLSLGVIAGLFAHPASAFDWTINELHGLYGRQNVAFAGGETERAQIISAQHFSGWKYGGSYAFVDFVDAGRSGSDIYAEASTAFSLEKISGNDIGFGPITDVGAYAAVNYDREAKFLKYLPGVRLVWDVRGLDFLYTDIAFFLDRNAGLMDGGAPKEGDSYIVNVTWAFPFDIAGHDFSIEGHIEYVSRRRNELGEQVSWWILGQPQFRYDIGKDLFGKDDRLYLGLRWNFWINKLGHAATDENKFQLLVVGRF